MKKLKQAPMLAAALLASCAAIAMAMSIQDIQAAADALDGDADSLAALIDDCPDGTCPGAGQLAGELDSLESSHANLEVELSALAPCTGCPAAASTLAAAGDDLIDMRTVVDGWAN